MGIGSKIQCTLIDVLYCILGIRCKFGERLLSCSREIEWFQTKDKTEKRKGKNRIGFENKGLNSIIFLSRSETEDNQLGFLLEELEFEN